MSTFLRGNYNEFDTLVHSDLPRIQQLFEATFLPNLDKCLLSMLGRGSTIERSEVNANMVCESGSIESFDFEVVYTIEDFQVPDAPKDAITHDTEAIQQALSFEGLEVKEVSIDTQTGVLHIVVNIPLTLKGSDTEVVTEDKSDELFGVDD